MTTSAQSLRRQPVSEQPLRIAIVANEPSGDFLAAGLIRALRELYPRASFYGVAGPLMQAEGCVSETPMERLSVMGLTEVVKHLPELLGIRRRLARLFLDNPPDVFIGVDAPDFNLGLERRLKSAGIPTVHYVSPTVWAWRSGRVKTLRRSADLVLSIFPFEEDFLLRRQVRAVYVGHPLAEQIAPEPDRAGARKQLGLDPAKTYIALLPGSRVSEVKALAEVFLKTAQWCAAQKPKLAFVSPMINARVRALFAATVKEVAPHLPISLCDAQSRAVLAAVDVVLTASGTATLEALLLKRPMVVAYRVSPLTYRIAKVFNLLKVKHVAMANLLAGAELAPEFIQDAAQPEQMGQALLHFLDHPDEVAAIQQRYGEIQREMLRDSSAQAAAAVAQLIERK